MAGRSRSSETGGVVDRHEQGTDAACFRKWEVIEPDDGILTIGSGGNYALAAARALKRRGSDLSAKEIAYESLKIASEICVFTNDNIIVEEF